MFRDSRKQKPKATEVYLDSFALWQINSIEKLKAKAKAIVCQIDCALIIETTIITRQKRLVTTVRAFFSVKYFFSIKFRKMFNTAN